MGPNNYRRGHPAQSDRHAVRLDMARRVREVIRGLGPEATVEEALRAVGASGLTTSLASVWKHRKALGFRTPAAARRLRARRFNGALK
jgi:hypothetical protein